MSIGKICGSFVWGDLVSWEIQYHQVKRLDNLIEFEHMNVIFDYMIISDISVHR